MRQSGLKVARMIHNHWDCVINALLSNVANATSEGMNSHFKWIQRKVCSCRNRENFGNAVYFHCGALDPCPTSIQIAHWNSHSGKSYQALSGM